MTEVENFLILNNTRLIVSLGKLSEWKVSPDIGTAGVTKTDEFSEKFEREGGHFQSNNLCCIFWTFKKVLFGHFSKKSNIIF